MAINPFDTMRMRMGAFRANIGLILRDSVRDAAPMIEDKIIEQLQRGERGDGVVLPDYSPISVAFYGKPAGPIRLYDTGEFYMGITIIVYDDGFAITGRDRKTPELVFDYGAEIIELQPQSWIEIREDILTVTILDHSKRYIRDAA